jgi:outer membrane protein OmpA-like peptidoglycan-associated protein
VGAPAAILAVALGAAAATLPADRAGFIPTAQAQSEADRRKKERERRKAAPPKQQPAPSFKPPRAAPKISGPSEKPALRKHLPLAKEAQEPSPLEKRGAKAVRPLQPRPGPDLKKEGVKRLPSPPGSGQHGVGPPLKRLPPPELKGRPVKVAPAPKHGPAGPGIALKRFDDVKRFRLERIEAGGKRKVIEEPGKLFIIKESNRVIVRHDETERFLRRPGAKLSRRQDGTVETVYVRGDVRIVTVVDAHGRLLRRYRRDRDGRERNLIDNRRFYRGVAIGVGIGALAIVALDLPPPRVTIPHEQYIVDYDEASDDDLYEALDAPPIEVLDRAYSLEEIRDNYELRARVRSIDINTINFEFGAWEVPPDQYGRLERIARAILRLLERNAEAVVMIAGHTDAVGSEEDNASLSQRRAAAVAEVLTDEFDVPPENLVTQGYGEQYLKIDTQGPEPRNRRVKILNITALMAER